MARPIVSRALAGCELLTLAALLASLASMAPPRHSTGDHLLPAGTGPRDAFAACARFIGGGAIPEVPPASTTAPITSATWRS